MKVFDSTTKRIFVSSWVLLNQAHATENGLTQPHHPSSKPQGDIFQPLRQWLDNIQVRDPQLARRLCKLIPAQCPFERDVNFLGKTLFHIPPMCKINPVYEELVGLRFRAMCYLADECGEDVTQYC